MKLTRGILRIGNHKKGAQNEVLERPVGSIPLVLLLTFGPLVVPAHASVTITVDSACSGSGFSGTLSDGAVSPQFEACTTASGVYAKIFTTGGQVVSHVVMDEAADSMTVTVAGIAFTGSNTSAELDQIRAALRTGEGDLLGNELWRRLVGAGRNPVTTDKKTMAAIGAALMLYDQSQAASGSGGCFGCCGPGAGVAPAAIQERVRLTTPVSPSGGTLRRSASSCCPWR